MSAHWLYCPDIPDQPGQLVLRGAEAQHARAKRLRTGEQICLFDGRGKVATAEVHRLDRHTLSAQVRSLEHTDARQPRLSVAVSPPKGERLDWMLEKLTELAVAAIQPLRCERTVAEPRPERLDRWERRLIEAAKQAHVAWLPQLLPPCNLGDLLARTTDFTHVFVADSTAKARPRAVFLEYLSRHSTILVIAATTSEDVVMVVRMIPAAASVNRAISEPLHHVLQRRQQLGYQPGVAGASRAH